MVKGIIGERKQYIATQTAPLEELSLCHETSYELTVNQSRLDSVLNGHFGRGENSNSLLPNVRGYFSRVWNNGSEIDSNAEERTAFPSGTLSGDKVGTLQKDIYMKHDHNLTFSANEANPIEQGAPMKGLISDIQPYFKTQDSGGLETRPKNFSELYTIKWA